MPARDPKQALIEYLTNARFHRDERGIMANVETLLFLQEKAGPHL